MRANNVKGAFIITALLLLPAPAQAEQVIFRTGDVLCYEEVEGTCCAIGTVTSVEGDRLRYSRSFRIGRTPKFLSFDERGEMTLKPPLYCLGPKPVVTTVTPKSHPMAQKIEEVRNSQANKAIESGFCVEHRRCGDLHMQWPYRNGKPLTEGGTLYRLYHDGDPAIKKLSLRSTDFNEKPKPVPQECLPAS